MTDIDQRIVKIEAELKEIRSSSDKLSGAIRALSAIGLSLLVTIVGGAFGSYYLLEERISIGIDKITRAGAGECSIFDTLWEFNTWGDAGKDWSFLRLGTIAFTRQAGEGVSFETAGYWHPHQKFWKFVDGRIYLSGSEGEREFVRKDLGSGFVYRWSNPTCPDCGHELVLINPALCTSLKGA